MLAQACTTGPAVRVSTTCAPDDLRCLCPPDRDCGRVLVCVVNDALPPSAQAVAAAHATAAHAAHNPAAAGWPLLLRSVSSEDTLAHVTVDAPGDVVGFVEPDLLHQLVAVTVGGVRCRVLPHTRAHAPDLAGLDHDGDGHRTAHRRASLLRSFLHDAGPAGAGVCVDIVAAAVAAVGDDSALLRDVIDVACIAALDIPARHVGRLLHPCAAAAGAVPVVRATTASMDATDLVAATVAASTTSTR